jgi:outer membrane protein OmpU
MNNFKKIGLTALAGSLIATTAMAGSLSVSGGAKLSHTTKGGTSDPATGNNWGMQKLISFTGGGELDNGHSIALSHYMTAEGAQSSSILSYDMGDAGKISFTDAAGGLGIAGIDDLMPTAVEEVWDGLGGAKTGYVSQASSGFEYTNTSIDGVKVEIGYGTSQAANDDGGVGGAGSLRSSESIAIQYTGIEGANIFFGTGTVGESATTDTDVDTMGATYSMGAATVGLQRSTVDTAALAEHENTSYSISFAVNDDLSVSYGESTTEITGSVDQEIKGFSVGYSMGGLTLQAHANEGDNVGNAVNNFEHTELTVSFAF